MPGEGARNRVLVGVPERLRRANEALREHEALVGYLRQAYEQRGQIRDSAVLNQIGDLLGMPKYEGAPSMEVASPDDFRRMKERERAEQT